MGKLAIRSQIIAPPGKRLIAVDLSQAEAWIVAAKAEEEKMFRALNGGDIHSQTACIILDKPEGSTADNGKLTKDDRYLGKKCNHAFNYRMGPARAAEVINKEGIVTVTQKDTKKFHQAYINYYLGLRKWWTEIEEKLRVEPILTTVYGRKRRFYQPYGDELFKEATAFEPQSTVADHMFGAVHPELGIKGGILEVYNQIIKPSAGEIKAINTSHDSLILECPVDLVSEITGQTVSIIRRPLVINGNEFTIPVDAEIGERWGEMEKVKL